MGNPDGKGLEFIITAYLIRNEEMTHSLIGDLKEARRAAKPGETGETAVGLPDYIFPHIYAIGKIPTHRWNLMEVNYPETIVDVLYSSMGCMPAYCLLTKFFACKGGDFTMYKTRMEDVKSRNIGDVSKTTIKDALGSLSCKELSRVKRFLTWSVCSGLKGMRFGSIENTTHLELAHAIRSRYAVDAAFVLHSILVQIARRDLAEDMVSVFSY